ncbi:MAG: glycine zipper 2TM domain-containing protein [Maricaulaceae bacterium]|jgi:hypothetical protein
MAYRLLSGAAACALLAATPTFADDHRWRGGGHSDWGYSDWDRHGGRDHRRHHDDDGDDAALLIGGAIVGLALGSLLSDNSSSHSSGSYYSYSQPSYAGYSQPYYPDPFYQDPYYSGGYGLADPGPSYGYAPPSYGYGAPSGGVTYVNETQYAGAGCQQVRSGRTASGAVIGGIIGGLMGNGIAADGNRDEGTAVGAVLGSVVGGSIGSSSADCASAPAQVYQSTYPSAPAPYYGGGAPAQQYPYQSEPELYGGPDYEYRDYGYEEPYEDSYSGPAARECERVMRVTPLPDGREIHEPVEVCREAYYGDWSTKN